MQYRMLQLCTGVLLATGLYHTPTWADDSRCVEPIATLAALEGRADVTGKAADCWRPVTAKEAFCPGDRIRVGAASRAAELLANHTVMRLDALTTVSFTGPRQADNLWVELLRGVGHFISRVPRRLTVSTPYVNAGVEGTEFLVSADDSAATVSVFEGRVAATNPQGTLLLTSGQTATARSGAAPVLRVTLRPRDGLQWALHYPPVIQFDAAAFAAGAGDERQVRITQSLARFKEGDNAAALAALNGLGRAVDDSRLLSYRASLYLAAGRIDAARADIDRALVLAANDGDALALKSVIALAQNDKAAALQLAQQAVNAAPRAGGPRLALSYAWQAQFDLERARAEAQQGVEIDPHNALAWARLAELQLMFGDRDAALAAAQEAERLNPRLAQSQSVLGFAHLSRTQLAAARQSFENSATLDPGDPLPRLGLGLVEVREGRVTAGRQQMELAAALDPDDALVRSYLGKAYYEEKRDARAESQFDMAKTLDPNDPTPWFYEAILEHSSNRPFEALQ